MYLPRALSGFEIVYVATKTIMGVELEGFLHVQPVGQPDQRVKVWSIAGSHHSGLDFEETT